MGLGRKLSRSKQKEDYKKFCDTWELFKSLPNETGDQYRSVKRPTFKQWLLKSKELSAKKQIDSNVSTKEDLSWDE